MQFQSKANHAYCSQSAYHKRIVGFVRLFLESVEGVRLRAEGIDFSGSPLIFPGQDVPLFTGQERVRRRQRDKLAALLLEKVGVTGDLKASDFASITREDGKKQGMPLYYFARDAAPGDTKGDGVKEIWSLAKP